MMKEQAKDTALILQEFSNLASQPTNHYLQRHCQ
jgi:hypothetical protein